MSLAVRDPLTVSEGALRRLMGFRGDADDRDALLAEARLPRHKLGATLLSVWERDGQALTVEHRAELAAHRQRIERYRLVREEIRLAAPDSYVLKGPEVVARYPVDVVRAAGDLDVVCRAPHQLWRAADRLAELGWEVGAFTVMPPAAADRHPDLLVELRLPGVDALGLPWIVELRTTDVATSLRERPHRVADPYGSPIAATLTALLAERWERSFTSRDLLDVILLAAHQTDADVAALKEALDQTGLWPEWAEMSRGAARLGWLVPPWLPVDRVRIRRERAARLVRSVTGWAHPVRAMAYVAQSTVDAERGRLADRIATLLHERIGAGRVLDLGMPLFGVPLKGCVPAEREDLRVVRRGARVVAHSPVGSFLMVSGACQQAWLDEEAPGGGIRGAGARGA